MINKPSLSIIIPAFNEEENINYSHDKLIKVIEILIEKKKKYNEKVIKLFI